MLRKLLNILVPVNCTGCGEWGDYLCKRCTLRIQTIPIQLCHVCKRPAYLNLSHKECREYSYLDGVIVGFHYEHEIKKLIRDFKYNDELDIVNILSIMLAKQLQQHYLDIDMIVPVPMFIPKKWIRGYNQAELLAKKIGRLLSLPINNVLVRKEATTAQSKLGKSDRQNNLSNVFSVKTRLSLKDKKVILIDDVMTTGATLEQCAKQLKAAGCANVYGVTVAAVI